MVADAQSAQEAAYAIREDLRNTFSQTVANNVRILYGGSVTSQNASTLIQEDDVDGFLIGGAALDAQELADIVNIVNK